MSRIGKKPIPVPSTVKVELKDHTVKASGPRGELVWQYPEPITVDQDTANAQLVLTRADDSSRSRALHGLARALIANMIYGVDQGYSKDLEIYGTGYNCQVKGQQLLLSVGYMGLGIDKEGKPREAQFFIDIPQGVTVTVKTPAARGDSDPARLTIAGPDKQKVGQFAAEVRGLRPPEPYKGKGIRYAGEQVRRKQGKAFVGGGG